MNEQDRKLLLPETMPFILLRLTMILVFLAVVYIFYDIVKKGFGVISFEFITAPPKSGMTAGGIMPAILGTIYVTFITALAGMPVGFFAAIYLNEYAKRNLLTRIIRLSIRNLAGVPSMVYGMFGVALFVHSLSFGTSILSAGLTLGLLTLPVIITTAEEALKSVPEAYREGALALGASKWHSIRTNVIPSAFPGILTGMILGLSRATGETAPILFTGAAFFLPRLPTSIDSQFMALPYHLFIMATQHHAVERVRPLAYGTAVVLVAIVLAMNFAAIVLRAYYRRKLRG